MSAKPTILYFDEYDIRRLKNIALNLGVFVNDYEATDRWFVDLIEKISNRVQALYNSVHPIDILTLSDRIEDIEAEITKMKKINELFVIE